jgi:hypothetical protein
MNVLLDTTTDDDRRRTALYGGDVVLFPAIAAAMELVELAREYIADAFAPHDPTVAQYHLPVEEYARILGELKPAFIHDDRCKQLIPRVIEQVGGDPSLVHFDIPRLRTATAHDYLTSGIAYAFHPHRDTWYSAPQAQINWWFPVYEMEADNGMAFHPGYFARGLPNSSDTYNYYRWNLESRASASRHVGTDARVQPRITEEIDLGPDLRVVVPVGGGFAFSGQQLHSTVPNRTELTRYSIDFRTVHRGDLEAGRGAPRVDSHCTGTSLRDFLNGVDRSRLPEELIARYDDESALEFAESLVYQPPESATTA